MFVVVCFIRVYDLLFNIEVCFDCLLLIFVVFDNLYGCLLLVCLLLCCLNVRGLDMMLIVGWNW